MYAVGDTRRRKWRCTNTAKGSINKIAFQAKYCVQVGPSQLAIDVWEQLFTEFSCRRCNTHYFALQYRKLNDRRPLDNLEAENVVIVWKVFPDDEDQQIGEDIHIDTILTVETIRDSRRCAGLWRNTEETDRSMLLTNGDSVNSCSHTSAGDNGLIQRCNRCSRGIAARSDHAPN